MTYLNNIEEIKSAIDNYNILNKTQKNVLKELIKASVDGKSIISIKEICGSIKTTTSPVSKAIHVLEDMEIIEGIMRRGIIFTGCQVKESKIKEIIERHKAKTK